MRVLQHAQGAYPWAPFITYMIKCSKTLNIILLSTSIFTKWSWLELDIMEICRCHMMNVAHFILRWLLMIKKARKA